MFSVGNVVLQIISLYFTVHFSDGTPYPNTTYPLTHLLRVSRQINKKGCVLPQKPKFGSWSIYDATSELFPGQITPSGTILQVTCIDSYKLDGDAALVCIHGEWTTLIGKCLRACEPIYSTSIMTATCTHNERKLDNCENAVDGTIARFQCADFYEDQGLERHPVHVCSNGKWSHTLPECVPICGQKSVSKDPTLIVNGSNATRGDYPWQVALYNESNKLLICGGSLLNQRVVLTAAHCVTDKRNGYAKPKELFVVAVGKYYRDYDDPTDLHEAQFSPIYEIYIPKNYKGDIQNYFGDIAILVTKKTFTLSTRVQPVCIDWAFKRQNLLNPTTVVHGYVSGWGFTSENNNPSAVLKELKVPLITDKACDENFPEDYKQLLTDDKMCAGFLDRGTSVCKGDSGGGLVTRFGNRYYIIAVVSLSPTPPTAVGGCDSQQYALYTKVSYYINSFILEKEARHRPSPLESVDCEDDPNCRNVVPVPTTSTTTTTTAKPVIQPSSGTCVLPEHPSNGQWAIFGAIPIFSPGTAVESGTILKVTCSKGYKSSSINLVLCESGKWNPEIPECLRPCPSIQSTDTTKVTCSFKDKDMKDCSEPVDGTIAKHKCALFYEDLQLAKNPVRVCRNGSWDIAVPECVPVCGLKSAAAQPLIVNGNAVKKGEYPWQVAIYGGRNKRDRRFLCGGVLISRKLILTAAHCVSNVNGQIQQKENYIVAVGKYYSDFFDPLDYAAQISEVEDIFIPLQYTGIKNNFFGNIAVLVSERNFELNSWVQPVCVDWSLKYVNTDSIKNLTGYISGWGYTESDSRPAEALQSLEVPIISNLKCVNELPDGFATYLTADSFCAGYLNKQKSACQGDSGGALVTKHDGRYYATGIISRSPASPTGGCDINQYSIYTKVSDYVDFILEKEAKTRSSSSSQDCDSNGNSCQSTTTISTPTEPPTFQITNCTLPQHPSFGKWSVFSSASTALSPGRSVIPGTILQTTCYSGYKLQGDTIILCENGKWSSSIGRCLKTCPPVYSTSILKATCIEEGKTSENCTEPTDGTRVKYECAPFYEDPQLSISPTRLCRDGSWDYQTPSCIPVCGQKSMTPQLLIVGGDPVKKGDYPWHVGIYDKSNKEFLCSGTLISQKVILTAAHCIMDGQGRPKAKQDFLLAAGKSYRKFDDDRDKGDAQSSALSDMFLPSEYAGPDKPTTGSIAILIPEKTLTLSRRVQPACVDWNFSYERELKTNRNLTGYVTGWGLTTESGNPADHLQELQVPIVSDDKCIQALPQQFKQLVTPESLCAGYINEGKSLCQGDSGGGLVVKFGGRYYVTGIVTAAPKTSGDNCDIQQYAVYAKTYHFIDNFILQKTQGLLAKRST